MFAQVCCHGDRNQKMASDQKYAQRYDHVDILNPSVG